MFKGRPLPASVERANRHHKWLTIIVGWLLIFGPSAGLLLVFGPTDEDGTCGRAGEWQWLLLVSIIGLPVWLGFQAWRFRRWCRCPTCSGRLKWQAPLEQPGNCLLECVRCEVRWDSGEPYIEPQAARD